MKMRLGDTLIELDNIAYAQKLRDTHVRIYFVGREKALLVSCQGETGLAAYPGSADELLSVIETGQASP